MTTLLPTGHRSRIVGVARLATTASMTAAALVACAPLAPAIDAAVTQAWVQAADGDRWVVRAATASAICPSLRWDQGSLPLTLRAPPVVVPVRHRDARPEAKAAEFGARSCEVEIPPQARSLSVAGIGLPAPPAQVRRIVFIGDTGCRMKRSDDAFQDCNDAAQWPFGALARAAAAKHPDLVVHVGDLHYRESPCPDGRSGCAGSPWGYGADTWQADFFDPAAPLLAAAPWVFARGNHESCGRAGVGWFRYLDGHPWSPRSSCEQPGQDGDGDFSEPYAVPIGADTQLIVFDSAVAADRAYEPGSPVFERYAAQLRRVDALARRAPHSIFVIHHPVLAFTGSASGRPGTGGAGLRSVMEAAHPGRLFGAGIDLVVNGHVHLFEALDFATAHPAELLVGNGGSATDGWVDAALARGAQPAPGAVVGTFVTGRDYGFATLDRTDAGWLLTQWSVAGQASQVCRLGATKWDCEGPR